ncbi:hypothetical protein ABEV34_11955 [Methylorubrum rhodesianum]|uniref:hypothetical protein n=1 Tax=Methylorubrum rhodesianum TaxID=29427 RepID=UPI003D2B9CFE
MSGAVANSGRRVWTPSDLSGIALIVFALAQVFSYKLISGSETQLYINDSPNYNAQVEYVGTVDGRSPASKYRLKFEIITINGPINCDVVKAISIPAAPILSRQVKVTPRQNTCEDPYLTDLEFWPRFHALLGLGLTALGGALLLASALWHRRLVMEALARQSSRSGGDTGASATAR